MSVRANAIEERRLELQRAFDRSFAEPERERGAAPVDLLVVRAGQGKVALRVADLAGVQPCGRIAPLPGGPEGLLGIAGVRGRLHAVYDLADLLGDGAAVAPRWLLLAKAGEPVAFAVGDIAGYLRADPIDLLSLEGARPGGHVGWALLHGGERLGVLSISSLLSTIEQRTPARRRARQV